MQMVECITLDGSIKKISAEQLILRPAAYAIILQAGNLLLLQLRRTGKYHLPGGGLEPGESLPVALRREIREETGLEVGGLTMVHFEEIFFYYDPSGRAYHGLHFFYTCQPLTSQVLPDEVVEDGSAACPRWLPLTGLQPADFQVHGDVILKICSGISPSG